MVDGINPARPLIRSIPIDSHSLGSLRQCRIYSINSTYPNEGLGGGVPESPQWGLDKERLGLT